MNRRELMKLAGAALVSPLMLKAAGPSVAQSGTSQGTVTISPSTKEINPADAVVCILHAAGQFDHIESGSHARAWQRWDMDKVTVPLPDTSAGIMPLGEMQKIFDILACRGVGDEKTGLWISQGKIWIIANTAHYISVQPQWKK